mmetsp:Transcript_17201/g.28826  ORF Transcript_17201/g.28826 Transcript_17201/m.28826 type:complete len:231 (-) Transcript_17201:63-755(-)|eukprot:CAMPEP_0119340312 /NCGR_PEP_ID=MMETSP1333-20130426/100108_1 /TAXON_ID=418940 /ORGANISM="Scyphosphaera apsteinii, Strain RCC1455" /LENGTH=230 /DNA_ID=CAMNT_0007352043 /DNA_START=189 /DNA_END=881 /DNA_ORIENTATION=-
MSSAHVVLRGDGGEDRAPQKDFGIVSEQRTSNLAATRSYYETAAESATKQATTELQSLFDSIQLGDYCARVAAALCSTRHKTWPNAIQGLNQWIQEDRTSFTSRMQDTPIRLNLQSISSLTATIIKAAATPPTKCIARVHCGETNLKVTLTPKFLVKTLAEAMVSPCLKAYNKRAEHVVSLNDVERVEIDGKHVNMLQEAAVLLQDTMGRLRDEVLVRIMLRTMPGTPLA